MDSFNLQISYPLQPIDIALQYGILSFSVNHKPNLAFSANGLMMSFIFMIKPLIHTYIKLRPATPVVNQSAMIRINFAIYHSGILNPTCHFANGFSFSGQSDLVKIPIYYSHTSGSATHSG